jgi:hypothetical protein
VYQLSRAPAAGIGVEISGGRNETIFSQVALGETIKASMGHGEPLGSLGRF